MINPKRPPQPVVPYFLLSGLVGEEEFNNFEYEKTDNNSRSRFNLPIAKLVNLPAHLCQETFQLKIDDSELTIAEFWTEGQISFLGLSQLKYIGAVNTIHLATFLASPAAINLGFQAPESLTLRDGTTVMVSASEISARGYTGAYLVPVPDIDLTDDTPRIVTRVHSNEGAEDEPLDPRFHPSFHHQIALKKDDYIVSVASDLDLQSLKEIVVQYAVIQ